MKTILLILPACAGLLLMTSCAVSTGGYGGYYTDTTLSNHYVHRTRPRVVRHVATGEYYASSYHRPYRLRRRAFGSTSTGEYGGSSFDYGDQAAANTQAQVATDTANYANAAAAMSGPPPVPPQ